MRNWLRYQEVDLTDEEQNEVGNGQLINGVQIDLIAQSDMHGCVFGKLSRTGNILATDAGYSDNRIDWDKLDDIAKNYGGEQIPDDYVNYASVRLPTDTESRRKMTAALKKI